MISLINPKTSRLGISHFWVVNVLPTISSNYSILEKYKYQNYIDCLNDFCNVCFLQRFRINCVIKLGLIYSNIKLNVFGFDNQIRLDIVFFDFYLKKKVNDFRKEILKLSENMHNVFSIMQKFKERKIEKDELKIKDVYLNSFDLKVSKLNQEEMTFDFFKKEKDRLFITKKMFQYNKHLVIFIKVYKKYIICVKLLQQLMEEYLLRFKTLLRYIKFKKRLGLLHKYFFPTTRLICNLRILSASDIMIDARFICIFIERQLLSGFYAPKLISDLFRYVQSSNKINGFRVFCVGRFIRGQKASSYKRYFGFCTFGSFNTEYTLDYCETVVMLKPGLVGIKVWISKNDK